MTKTIKLFILTLTILSLTVPMGGIAFASPSLDESVIIKSISSISVTATRPSTTAAKVSASGYLTAMASSITTKATLYEYNSSTGSLTAANVSPVTKTIYNCSSYSFSTTFSIQEAKKYKVKLEIADVTNGKTNKNTYYSSVI